MNIYRIKKWGCLLLLSVFMLSCSENGASEALQQIKHNKIYGVSSYRKCFGDLNQVHLASARKIGIEPIKERSDFDISDKSLLFVGNNDFYNVDRLTHSIPYLVPRANAVLMAISMNFQDSMASKGLDKYKLIVTSVLRTKEDVKKLKRKNVNASMNSAHFYGTTFDISYNRFIHVDENGNEEEVRELNPKLVLSEVLRDLKDAGLCYVKYEVKQGCFHITARE